MDDYIYTLEGDKGHCYTACEMVGKYFEYAIQDELEIQNIWETCRESTIEQLVESFINDGIREGTIRKFEEVY